jgi:hypothetical protein
MSCGASATGCTLAQPTVARQTNATALRRQGFDEKLISLLTVIFMSILMI